jgi:hypothetical protein
MKENIIIFGTSTRGKYVYQKLKDKCNIIYFCDNDKNRIGGEIEGIKIISPKDLSDLNYKVIIASMYHQEISAQLNNMGIHNFEIYPSAMECVISRLKEKEINLNTLHALEVFGGNGESVEKYYVNLVKELDVWEINESFEVQLKNNLPKANIKIVDSFEEIKRTNKTYEMVVIDNPMQNFGEHCENFDMFIDIFKVVKNEAIIILDIMPNIEDVPIEFNYLKSSDHILCRKLFYRTTNPLKISVEEIVETYKDIIHKNNYELEWYFTEERSSDFIYYLVLKVIK